MNRRLLFVTKGLGIDATRIAQTLAIAYDSGDMAQALRQRLELATDAALRFWVLQLARYGAFGPKQVLMYAESVVPIPAY